MKAARLVSAQVIVDVTTETYMDRNSPARVAAVRECCTQVAKEIKRHVNNVLSATPVVITEEYCTECRRRWETEDDTKNGCPCCCDAAVKEWEAVNSPAKAAPDA